MDRREFLQRGAAAGMAAWVLPHFELVQNAGRGNTNAALRELARVVRGPVITRTSSSYRSAKRVYNAVYNGISPLAIAYCESTADVAAAIKWSAKYDIQITARSGGHSYAGYSTVSGGVIVDVSRLRTISVGAGVATIGAGARLIDVYSRLSARGVTIPAGSCPTVGIGGLVQGGGQGLAQRNFGLTCDALEAATVVTADGTARRVSGSSDLFWAIRGGGGGNFGIATSFTFKPRRVSSASYYTITYPWSQASAALAAWQSFAPTAPNALMSILALSSGRSVTAFGQYFGGQRQLAAVVRPLTRVSGARLSSGSASYMQLMLRWAGCAGESIAHCGRFAPEAFHAKSDFFSSPISSRGRGVLTSWLSRGAGVRGLNGSIILDAGGGAVNRVKPDATAYVHRNDLFSAQYLAYWTGSSGPATQWLNNFHAAMRPYASGQAYQNYIDPDLTTWRQAYYGSNYAQLVEIKKKYDPDRLFRFRQAIGS
jgi:FAD/FMN-containing dehydrogenase